MHTPAERVRVEPGEPVDAEGIGIAPVHVRYATEHIEGAQRRDDSPAGPAPSIVHEGYRLRVKPSPESHPESAPVDECHVDCGDVEEDHHEDVRERVKEEPAKRRQEAHTGEEDKEDERDLEHDRE